MSVRTKAFIALLLVSMLWGSAGVVAKILIRQLHPYVVLFYRFGIAAIVLLPWFIKAIKPNRMWRVLIPFSLLVAGNAVFFYLGISRTTVSSSAIIGATVPLITAIFSQLFINEHTSKETFLGIIIGLAGAMYITLLPLWKEGKLLGGDIIGNLLLIAGILCWTLYVVGSRYLLAKDTYSPLIMVEINFLTLAVVSFILAICTRQPFFTPGVLDPTYLFVFVYSTVPVTVVSFGLFQWALKYISASTASLKDYIQLIVGVALSLMVLKETVNASFVIGSLIVILGIGIATGRPVLSKVMQRLTPIK
jgi:drug/metabolite transporter (DMT)-like permease